MSSPGNLVIFDLDGTLTARDTFIPFLLSFYKRRPAPLMRILLLGVPILQFALKRIDNATLKQKFLSAFTKGASRTQIDQHARLFVKHLMATGLRPAALSTLQTHIQNGDLVVLLSASFDFYVPYIAQQLKIHETICTQAEWRDDCLTGRLASPNCHGQRKVELLAALQQRHQGRKVIAYADNISDIPLLLLADDGFLISHSSRAIAKARQLGLSILHW